MTPHAQPERQDEIRDPQAGPLAPIPSLGFSRRRHPQGANAWRETVTQQVAWAAVKQKYEKRAGEWRAKH